MSEWKAPHPREKHFYRWVAFGREASLHHYRTSTQVRGGGKQNLVCVSSRHQRFCLTMIIVTVWVTDTKWQPEKIETRDQRMSHVIIIIDQSLYFSELVNPLLGRSWSYGVMRWYPSSLATLLYPTARLRRAWHTTLMVSHASITIFTLCSHQSRLILVSYPQLCITSAAHPG